MDTRRKHSHSGRGYRRKSKGATSTRPQKLNRIFTIVSAIVGGALLLLAAFVAGRNFAKPDVPAAAVDLPSTSQTIGSSEATTPALMEAIELALKHSRQDAISEAIEVLKPHAAQGNPSVALLLARLEDARGNAMEAVNWIGSDLPRSARQFEVHLFKAEVLAESGGHQAAFVEYEQAAQLAPLEARVFLSWGQALRIFGRSREAMQRLEQASMRTRNAADATIVQARILLARTELEPAASLREEAAPWLAAEPPDPLWQLAMASLALRENDPDTAAELLKGARTGLPAVLFEELVTDPAFSNHLNQPALSDLF